MMNRRHFVYGAAAGAAMSTSAALRVRGTDYDLILEAGRVIDSSTRLHAIHDGAARDSSRAPFRRTAADRPTLDAVFRLHVGGPLFESTRRQR